MVQWEICDGSVASAISSTRRGRRHVLVLQKEDAATVDARNANGCSSANAAQKIQVLLHQQQLKMKLK
jgi:hypothetical protein